MYSFARHDHGLAWVTLSAISLFVHGCGSMSADNPAGNGAAAGTDSVSPASDTLFSTIETPDFGRYDLVARGPDDGSGEWQFAVRSGRGAPTKNELRFVWDFGDGKTYEGVEQSYSFTTNGSYVIKVKAIKLDGTVAFLLTLNVEVAIDVNEPPIADAGTDQTADANALVFLYGGASSDPDGDPLTYQWVQISGVPVLLLHANEPTASFIAPSIPQDADLVFGVTVGDGGYAEQDTVVVRVLRLVQPAETFLVTADAGTDQPNVLQGTTVTLHGRGSSNPNTSPLTYAWSPLPGTNVTLQPTTDPAIVTFTAPRLAEGETSLALFFELVVSAGGQSASDEVRVTVTSTSEPVIGGTDPVPPVPTEPCVTSSPTWQNMPLTSQSGSFEFQFDAVPNNANMDGIVALSQGAGATFADYAVMVRFNAAGSIDIRNGAAYAAATSVPYSAGTNYNFRVVVDVPDGAYNVYVTPEGGAEVTLAADYAFRSEQSSVTSLANWAAWSDTGGSMNVCNAVLAVVALTASAGPDVIMAPGGSVTLSGSASGGELPYTYRWSPTTGLDNASVAQPTARPAATTTYTLTVTDFLNATANDTVTVTVQAAATLVANAGPDQTIAPGGSITLQGSASGGTPPYTFRWSPTTGLSNANIANPTATPSATTTYSLTVTDSLNATANDTVTVRVLVAIAGSDQTIAPGGSTTLLGSASDGTAPYTYRWSPTTGLNNANVASPTASPSATTTYTLTVTDSQSRTANDSAVVTVSTAPTGTTYYVATNAANASDTNPGTEASPWKTLTKAGNTARAGETVYVKAGTYTETLRPVNSGVAGSLITFQAYPGDECKGSPAGTKNDCRVVIDGQNTRGTAVDLSSRRYITISGLEIRNHDKTGDAIYIQDYYDNYVEGIRLSNNYIHHNGDILNTTNTAWAHVIMARNIRSSSIENNEIFANGFTAVFTTGQYGAQDLVIRDNAIHQNGGDGIRGCGTNVLIEGNRIFDQFQTANHQDAMDLAGDCRNVIIRNNVLFDLTQLIYFPFDGPFTLDNVQIYGNILYTDRYWTVAGGWAPGIFIPAWGEGRVARNVSIHSNTFGWVGLAPIYIADGGVGTVTGISIRNNIIVDGNIAVEIMNPSEVTSDYNLFYTFPGSLRQAQAWVHEGLNSVFANPQFANYSQHDFHLASGSPAIDQGAAGLQIPGAALEPSTDLDRNARPIDVPNVGREGVGAYDIGAYEFRLR